MRYDHLPYMPQTRALFADGTEFVSCRQNVGLCQPARVGFLTGQFARRNGVYLNTQYMTDPTKSLAPWLHDAGYSTGIIGKYPTPFGGSPLNGWTFQRTFTPATEQTAYGFSVFDGSTQSSPSGYQADYVAAMTANFVLGFTPPWFCWMTPTNPHVNYQLQLEPRPEDLDDWLDVEWPVVEDTLVGKPSWMQGRAPLGAEQIAYLRAAARGQLQELRAVDDGIASLFAALQGAGLLTNTIVIFTSDNGVLYSEHRMWSGIPSWKNVPYEPSMHVPLLARGPGFTPATTAAPVCTQDLTATCLAAATATPTLPIDGIDLRTPNPARVLLHERAQDPPFDSIPSGAGVTTANRKLWRHEAQDPDRYEMYLLDTDPEELTNVAYDPTYIDERTQLEAQLDALLQA